MKLRPRTFAVLLAALSGGAGAQPAETAASAETVPPRTGLIVPLTPPDTLSAPVAPKGPAFGEFSFTTEETENSLEVTLRSMFESHHISGPGRAASILEPGRHWLHDLELNARHSLGDNWTTEFNAILRYTDSRRHDPQTKSLQRLQFVASDQVNHLTLGDYYATLSQYSLNRAIKGIGYQRNIGEASYVRFVAGAFDARWNHLLNQVEDEPIDRHVTGLRAQTAGDNYRVGVNLVSAWDRDNDPVRTTEDTYRQILPAFDWEYRADSGLRLSGEHAQAKTRRQTAAGVRENLSGSAHRLNMDGTLGKLRLRGRAERVSPDFYTMGGGAALDRLRTYVRGDYRLDTVWSVYGAYDWFRNNLDGQLAATTRTSIPEVGVNARGLFDRRSLTFATSLRQRRVDTGAPQRREQVSERLYVSLADRFDQVSVRGEVEALLNTRKDTSPRQSNDDLLYRLVIDSRHLIAGGRYDLRPYLSLEHQEVEDPGSGRMVRTDGARFDLRLLTQGHLSYGLNLEHRSTENRVPGAEDTRLRRYALNLDSQPALLRGGTLRAEIGHAEYRFGDAAKNYRERYVRVLTDIPFNFGN